MIRLDKLPSWKERSIDFTPRDGFILTNASVTIHNGGIVALIHATDHWMDDRGVWLPVIGRESRCRFADNLIYVATFDNEMVMATLAEVNNDTLTPSPPWPFRGFEGGRLFSWNGDLWAGLATSGITRASGDEFYIGKIAPAVPNVYTGLGHSFVGLRRLAEYGKGKNWMPHMICGRQWFHYWPGDLIGPNGERRTLDTSPDMKHWHGGSQVLHMQDGWGSFAVVHDYDDVPGTFRRATRQGFMRFDATGRPTGVTEFRYHETAQLEITTGMAYHPDGERLMISYGRDEADPNMPRQERAFIATVAIDDVRGLL